jgi:hypothetical protein
LHALCYFSDFLSSFLVAALATANARIVSLEAELRASQKAYDTAAAAKANAEKSQKSALGKAKKAEKALADANKEHAQREQAMAERLHTISTAAESTFFSPCLLFSTSVALLHVLTSSSFFSFSSFLVSCRFYWCISIGLVAGR